MENPFRLHFIFSELSDVKHVVWFWRDCENDAFLCISLLCLSTGGQSGNFILEKECTSTCTT